MTEPEVIARKNPAGDRKNKLFVIAGAIFTLIGFGVVVVVLCVPNLAEALSGTVSAFVTLGITGIALLITGISMIVRLKKQPEVFIAYADDILTFSGGRSCAVKDITGVAAYAEAGGTLVLVIDGKMQKFSPVTDPYAARDRLNALIEKYKAENPAAESIKPEEEQKPRLYGSGVSDDKK